MAAGFRTIILAGFAIGGVGGVVLPDLKLNDALPIQDRRLQAQSINAEPFSALDPTATAEPGPADADTGQARPEGLGESEARETTVADSLPMGAPESPPVQIAALTPLDELHHDAKEEPNDIKTVDECLTSELCIDQYLWSLYQRARKVDTIKVVEQKKASVVKKGKLQTIIQKVVKLVREDFTWKDPAAAEKAGMQQMDYVIGGMDRSFKLRLYCALRAMDDAGLGPGITSAFRDDYRQSLASGLKAARSPINSFSQRIACAFSPTFQMSNTNPVEPVGEDRFSGIYAPGKSDSVECEIKTIVDTRWWVRECVDASSGKPIEESARP